MAMDDTATCSFHGGSGSVCGPRLPTDEDLKKRVKTFDLQIINLKSIKYENRESAA